MRAFLLSLLFAALPLGTVTWVRAYPGGPDAGVTGGFGEQTCSQAGCHTTFPLNAGREAKLGELLIEGLPAQYEPDRTYPITVSVSHTQERLHWGFQLAARMRDTGEQAGQLKSSDSGTQIVRKNGVEYVEHTLDGIAMNTFTFEWVAPSGTGPVVVHAAGNAADGDGSPEGDYIYSTQATTSAAK